jgi:hypothetical protein
MYLDPAAEKLSNGRSMSELMRPSSHGLRGVIIGQAGPGGAPLNFNPHDLSRVEINIEPDNPNGLKCNMGQITKENVVAAMAAARQKIAGNDIHAIRERAAVTFEELAKMNNSGVRRAKFTPPPVPSQKAVAAQVLSAESARRPPVEKISRDYSPLSAFGMKKNSTSPQPTALPPIDEKVGAPQKLIYFEKEGIGTVPAFFHDIITLTGLENDSDSEETGFMVLIYDLRFEQNAARWFPPANDPYGRPWAVQIHDDSRLYLVQTTGFQYVYDNREYCILAVDRAVFAGGE